MNKHKIDYDKEDILEFYKNKILLDWIKNHHPEIIEKVEEFLKINIKHE